MNSPLISAFCPTCNRLWSVPANFLNRPCCAIARDTARKVAAAGPAGVETTAADLDAATTKAYKQIERALVGMIESIEGRVVSPDEIAQHGSCLVNKKGGKKWTARETYCWRGQPLIRATFFLRQGNRVVHKIEHVKTETKSPPDEAGAGS